MRFLISTLFLFSVFCQSITAASLRSEQKRFDIATFWEQLVNLFQHPPFEATSEQKRFILDLNDIIGDKIKWPLNIVSKRHQEPDVPNVWDALEKIFNPNKYPLLDPIGPIAKRLLINPMITIQELLKDPKLVEEYEKSIEELKKLVPDLPDLSVDAIKSLINGGIRKRLMIQQLRRTMPDLPESEFEAVLKVFKETEKQKRFTQNPAKIDKRIIAQDFDKVFDLNDIFGGLFKSKLPPLIMSKRQFNGNDYLDYLKNLIKPSINEFLKPLIDPLLTNPIISK